MKTMRVLIVEDEPLSPWTGRPKIVPAVVIVKASGASTRVHSVRGVTFGEDASDIRKNRGIFAHPLVRPQHPRFNDVENIANARYRAAIGGLAALQAVRFL